MVKGRWFGGPFLKKIAMQKTVIYFNVDNKKKYVSELSKRYDGKYVQIFTHDIALAKEFDNEVQAKEKISKFINHHDRVFLTENIEVTTSRRQMAGGELED